MKFPCCGRADAFLFQIIVVTYLLIASKPTDARTRISNFYHRFIRNAGDDTEEKNFIEKIQNSTEPVYNHHILATTELLGLNPSCAKLCPKVVDVNNEKIGCSVGTEETLKDDGVSTRSVAHPTILEAQYGVVKCMAVELNRTVLDDGLNVNLTCICQRTTIYRDPGVYCGPRNNHICTGTNAKWKDGKTTYFKRLFNNEYYYQGKVRYVMEEAKKLLDSGGPAVIARPAG